MKEVLQISHIVHQATFKFPKLKLSYILTVSLGTMAKCRW